jgi:hypothetical protein
LAERYTGRRYKMRGFSALLLTLAGSMGGLEGRRGKAGRDATAEEGRFG